MKRKKATNISLVGGKRGRKMKHIMISIKPEWVAKIVRGEKILEIRKSIPKDLPCKVYIYCSKNRHLACVVGGDSASLFRCCNSETAFIGGGYLGNGKIVAEFTLNKTTTHKKNYIDIEDTLCYNFLTKDVKNAGFYIGKDDIETMNSLCDFHEFVEEYGQGKDLYAWHIEDLHIYDQPKELAEFGLKRPFQSWGYLKDE